MNFSPKVRAPHGRGKQNGLSCASFRSARSSADQSIGLRSQGSWVRIPPGAPVATDLNPWKSEEEQMRALVSAIALAALAIAGAAHAQQYPTRNVNMVVPYAAGGPTDTVSRILGQAMGKPL